MHLRYTLTAFCFISVLAMGWSEAQDKQASHENMPHVKILDSQPRVILLTGGAQLTKGADAKRFIDLVQRHYDNKCPHHFEVVEANAGKKKKFNPQSWAEAARPTLIKAKAKKLPIIVLAHLPPLVTNPSDDWLIRNAKDDARIRAFADAFTEYAQWLRKDGADLVVLGMEGAVGPAKSNPQSPGTYAYLRLVSDEVARRSLPGIVVGPRIFQTFDKNRHLYVKKDHHISADGRVVISQLWYQSLCKLDGQTVPEWSQKALAELLRK